MDELVVVIMGVFIANYKTQDHPYLTSCVKALLIALLGFLWLTGKDLVNDALTLERLRFGFILAIGLWLALSLIFMLIELVFSGRK